MGAFVLSFAVSIEEQHANSMEAAMSYNRALREGCMSLPRTRVFLVGPSRSGKTSVKRLLLGQPHNMEETSTAGVDADVTMAVFDRAGSAGSGPSPPWKAQVIPLEVNHHLNFLSVNLKTFSWTRLDKQTFFNEQ